MYVCIQSSEVVLCYERNKQDYAVIQASSMYVHMHTYIHMINVWLFVQVKPMLEKYRVDAYLAGHDHTLQVRGLYVYVCGAYVYTHIHI